MDPGLPDAAVAWSLALVASSHIPTLGYQGYRKYWMMAFLNEGSFVGHHRLAVADYEVMLGAAGSAVLSGEDDSIHLTAAAQSEKRSYNVLVGFGLETELNGFTGPSLDPS